MYIKNKKIKSSIIYILLCFLLGLGVISCDSKESKEVQIKINKYLNETYGEEFVVGDLTKHSNEGFSGKYYYGQAYKKSDPDMKFDVQWDVGKTGEYKDTYLKEKWSRQGTEDINKKLKEIYGEDIKFYFALSKKDAKEFKDFNYNEVISKSNGNVYFELLYYVPCVNALDEENEANKLNKIIQNYIKKNKIKAFSISVYYLKSETSDKIIKDLIDKKTYYIDTDKAYKENKLINVIYLMKSDKIDNEEDIIKKFKY